MTAWTGDVPGAGDTQMLRTAAVTVAYVADRVAELGAALAAHGSAADDPAVWAGRSRDVWCARRDDLRAQLGPVPAALDGYHGALVAYADEVEDIAARGQAALRDRTDAEDELAAARHAQLTLPPVADVLTPPTGPRPAAPATRVARAQRDIASAQRRLDDLAARRRLADSALLSALVPLDVGEWAELGRLAGGAGIVRPEQIDLAALGDAVAAAVDEAARDGADLAALVEVLEQWADSPGVLGSALDQLGGDRLAGVLQALDTRALTAPGEATAVTAAQQALRGALAVASQAWGPGAAEVFAEELLTGPHAALVVGYLFGDPEHAPVAPALARATAEQLEARELELGGVYVWQVDPGAGGVGPMARDLLVPLPPPSPFSVVDPAASVFRQLAASPRAVLDWFGAGTAGGDRVTYWFRDRDWTAGAGYGAPLGVWESLQGVPGALLGPGVDPALAELLARVNEGIALAWFRSGHRPAAGLGAEASAALAGVLAAQLPLWLELVLQRERALEGAFSDRVRVVWLGADGHGWASWIGLGWLREMLGYVAEDGPASARLREEVARLQLRLMQSVGSSELTALQHAERYAELLGVVDRARFQVEAGAAARHDEQVRGMVDVLGIPLGRGLGAAGVIGDVAVAVAGDAAADAWASRYREALTAFLAGTGPTGERRAEAERLLTVVVDGWLVDGVTVPEERQRLIEELMDAYADETGR